MPGPVIRMAPNPRRLTVRSPPTSMVPAAAAVGCAFTRYLLLVLTVSLSCPPPARGRRGRNSRRRNGGRRKISQRETSANGRPKDASMAFLLAAGQGGRSALHRHVGLEVLRQAGRRRLLKVAQPLQDFDRLHILRVDLTMGVYAP